MSSLVDYLRKADPRYNDISEADLILQTGEPAWKAKQDGDSSIWEALTSEFPDFEEHFHAARDRQSDWRDARNAALRGAIDDGVLMPLEGASRMVTADGMADFLNQKREELGEALPVDPGFAESMTGQVVRGVGQMAPVLGGGGLLRLAGAAKTATGLLAANAGGQAFQTGVDDAKASGVEDTATLRSAGFANLPGALLEFASDKLLVDRVLGPILKQKVLTPRQLVASVATNAAAEGLTEGTQQALTNFVASNVAAYDPDRPLEADVVQNVLVGAAVGGIASGAGTVAANEVAKRTSEPPKESVAVGQAQLILSRKQAELERLRSRRPAESQPSPEEGSLEQEIVALGAAINRDVKKLNGVNANVAQGVLSQVRREMAAIAGNAASPDAARAQLELRLAEIGDAVEAIEQKLGPTEDFVQRAGAVVARRVRERSPDEQSLLQEAVAIQQQLEQIQAPVSQQQPVESPAAPAPAGVDKAVARALDKVEGVSRTAAALAGDAVVAVETGQVSDPALSVMARVADFAPEPQGGAGAGVVDTGVETTAAPAPDITEPVAEGPPVASARPKVSELIGRISAATPPLALATEPLSKAKTAASGDAASKDSLRGRTIIALQDPATNEVLIRNYYEDKDGTGYAENMGARGSNRGVALKRLVESGWKVVDHPWLLAEPAEVNHRWKPEDYEAWKADNLELLARVQETQRDGTPAGFVNELLSESHPEFVNAVNYLVGTLAAESGAEPSAIYAGVLRPFSESDDTATNRAQREQVRFISEARDNPSRVLREVNGKILGIFSPEQFSIYTEAVNTGRVDEADAMVAKLAGKAAVYDNATEESDTGRGGADAVEGVGKKKTRSKEEISSGRFKGWARNMANLGRESLAYWAPGESSGRIVSTDTPVSEGQTISDTIAADGPAHPTEVIADDISVTDRAGLNRFGMSDNEIDYILSELEGVENPTKQEIHDVIEFHGGELAGFERALEVSENPRAVLTGTVAALLRLATAQSAGVASDAGQSQRGSPGGERSAGVPAGAGGAQSGAAATQSRSVGGGSEARSQDVAAGAHSGEQPADKPSAGNDRAGAKPADIAAGVTPSPSPKAARVSSADGVAADAALDDLFADLRNDLGDDVKLSEPTGPVRVGGQERASVVEKLVKALALLIEKGVRSFSVALQYIAKRTGSDVALSAADTLAAKWNEWRGANPQWGLDRAENGVKALTGVQAIRPPLQDLGEGKYPKVPDLIKDRYPSLSPEQKLAVNMMVYAAARGEKGFLLGDGTGVGKTRQILAASHLLAQYGGGKPVLVLTENRTILDGNFTDDARAMGLIGKTDKLASFPGVRFSTYTSLAQGNINQDHYAAVILDEGHKLRNPNSAAHQAHEKLKRDFTIISTATPLDEIFQSIYFLSSITGQSQDALAEKIGVRVKWEKDPFTGLDVPQIESVPGVTEIQATENLKALRDEAMRKGLIVRRVYPFFGKMELMPVQITEAQRREEMRIMAVHQDVIDNTQSFGGGRQGEVKVPGQLSARAKASGQRTLDMARWTESQKALAIFDDMKRQLAAGHSVAVMSDSSGPRMIQGLGGEQIDGLLDKLAALCDAAKIPYVDVRGGGNKAAAVAEFQSGRASVMLATDRSGGTGINLDDTKGDRPRTAYVATLPFSAVGFDQIIGRFSRRNTASPATVKFVFLADRNAEGGWHPASLSESRRVSNLSRKLALMRMMQGQKIDFDDIFGPMGNVEENERRLLSRTFTAPELGEEPRFSQPTGYTIPFTEEGATTDDIIDPQAEIVRELIEEGHAVSAVDVEAIFGQPDVPPPGMFRHEKERVGYDAVVDTVKYNLEGRFLVGAEVVMLPKRKDFGSKDEWRAAMERHRNFVRSWIQPTMQYLPDEKIPKEDEGFARLYFYDLENPHAYGDETGAAGDNLRAIIATKNRLVQASNRIAEEVMARYGVKKFWMSEGANDGDSRLEEGEFGSLGARSKIYTRLRMSGAFKYSRPITSRDLAGMNRSWQQAPRSLNFERYQRLRTLLADRGTNLRTMQSFAEQAKGAFFRGKDGARNIWTILENLIGPTDTDLGVLMHEVGHDLFSDVPRADQLRILRAVAALRSTPGSKFNIDEGTNRSLQVETGERKLEEFLVEGLKAQGIEATTATGYAQRLLRTLRELFYHTARILLEQVNRFSWSEAALDTIALKLYENRLSQFAAGDSYRGPVLTADSFTGGVGVEPEWTTQATGHARAETAPFDDLPPADEGSLAHNLQQLVLEAAGAKQSRPIGVAEAPEVRVHQNLAPINHQMEVEQRVINALPVPVFAPHTVAQANRTPWQVYRTLFGLPDLNEMKAAAVNLRDPRTGQLIPGVIPDFTTSMFNNEGLAAQARVDAFEAVGRQRHTVSDQLNADRGRVALLKNRQTRFVTDFDEARRNYLNADGLTAVLMRGIRQMLSDERKKIGLAYQRRGMVMQQLRELDARPIADIERMFGNVVARVFRNQISGRQFFDHLDALRGSGIDYQALGAAAVRRALMDKSAMPELTAETEDAKVLLATVLAFAKSHEHVMAKLELRREKSAAERTRLEEELKKLAASKLVITQRAINALPKTARFEDRIKQTYLAAKRRLKELTEEIAFIESRMTLARAALPVYDRALGELGGEIGARAMVHFGHGVVINNPPSPTATPQQVEAARFTIALDANRAITDRAALLTVCENQSRWLAQREATGAIDPLYLTVKAQRDEVLRGIASTEVRPAFERFKMLLAVSPIADRMAAIGTPLARSVGAMVNQFADIFSGLRQQTHRLSFRAESARDAAMKLLPSGLTLADYKALFLDPAKSIIEKEQSILDEQALTPEQARGRVWIKVVNGLLENPTVRGLVGANQNPFFLALRAHVDADHAVSKFYHDFTHERGIGVRDERVRVLNPATGKYEEGVRDSIPQGTMTFSRTLSPLAKQVYRRMADLGWGGLHSDGIADAYTKGGAAAVQQHLAKYVGDPLVARGFLRAMAENDSLAMFDAPVLQDGKTRPEADPSRVRIAWDKSGGDLVTFAENLFDLHAGTGSKAQYVEEIVGRMVEVYGALNATMRDTDPAGAGVTIEQVKGMVPGFQIESRVWERMPTAWSSYHTFDRLNTNDFNHRVAAQAAFGRDQGRLHEAFSSLASEAERARDSLENLREEVKGQALAAGRVLTSRREVERAMVAAIGADEHKRLRAIIDNASVIEPSRRGLISFFHQDTQGGMGVIRAPLQTAQTIAWALLQQPTSALMNLTDVFAPIIQGGASGMTVRQSFRMMGSAAGDLIGGLAESFGLQLGRQSHLEEAYHDLGLNDADVERKVLQITREYDPTDPTKKTNPIPRAMRHWIELQSFNINRRDSRHTALRPAAPFTTTAMVMNRAATLSMWKTAEEMVLRGLGFLRANTAANGDPGYKLTAADLGYRGLDAESFKKLEMQMADHGMDITRMVREAQARMAGPASQRALIGDADRLLLHGLAGAETQLESNLATMAPGAYTNPIARLALPLLGWSMRRALQVPSLFKHANGRYFVNENDEVKLNAVALGGLAVVAAAVPALLYSILIDEFQRRAIGKSRNLPGVTGLFGGDLTAGDRAVIAIENLNRVGTFGMIGDVMNMAASSASGKGDNRSLSLDQRIVAASAGYSLMRAVNTLINQNFEVDYPGVVRPLVAALGGNGYLQWAQIANNALDLDNAESRFIRRLNVANEMRVYGRLHELDVKPSASTTGGSASTPITPHVVEMQLAALADDYQDFVVAWKKAVAATLAHGGAATVREAETQVKRSFQARHPLRSVFRSIGSNQYIAMLGGMTDRSAEDVRGAVDTYNRYARTIGIAPYYGGEDKPTRPTLDMDEGEIRAAMLGMN